MVYIGEHQKLLINCVHGALVIAGPKVLEFYDDFCARKVTVLKADGHDIVSVEMNLAKDKTE